MRLISVVMKEDTIDNRTKDTTRLLDYGFNTYETTLAVDKDKKIKTIKIELAKNKEVDIYPNRTVSILKKKADQDKNITYNIKLETITAPLKKNSKVGSLDIYEDNNKIDTVDLIVLEKIEKDSIFKVFANNLRKMFQINIF